ncbi:MAG TPA: choice-of-anchor J domain-containing protein, partial [Flavobacteriaceae bacterium]|nr:choice-of-anchor J domain-containing protein [Flavobacteriaceae bacterium]
MKKITLLCILATCFLVPRMHAQFMEGFETGMPATWTVINGGDTNTWLAVPPANGTAYEGTNVASIAYDALVAHDDYLITPQITVTAGVSDQFSFFARNYSTGFPDTFSVMVSTTGTAEADFSVLDGPITPPGTWEEYVYDLSAYAGQNIYIAFHTTTVNGWYIFIDEVVSGAIPTCPKPSDLTATGVLTDSATLAWTESGSAATWDIEVVPAGTTPTGTADYTGVTTNPYDATGLNPATDYEFYVR